MTSNIAATTIPAWEHYAAMGLPYVSAIARVWRVTAHAIGVNGSRADCWKTDCGLSSQSVFSCAVPSAFLKGPPIILLDGCDCVNPRWYDFSNINPERLFIDSEQTDDTIWE